METLTLNDGTELTGHILPDSYGDRIFVYLDGMGIADGYALFSDPGKTRRITAMNHGDETVYTGFTEIMSVSAEYGNCNLVMRRGNNA